MMNGKITTGSILPADQIAQEQPYINIKGGIEFPVSFQVECHIIHAEAELEPDLPGKIETKSAADF